MSAEATTQAVVAYLDAINAGDAARAVELVAEDFVNEHTSSLGNSLRGRVAYGERLPRFLEEFRGLHYEVEDLIVSGERAAAAYTMRFEWTAPTGTVHPVTIRGMFRFRVIDGHIAHRVDYWDGTDFQRQISGATAAP
ncbi:MAG TPA: nuclear transport factor 2 family protein [Acidimicrobiales bacterium]